MSSSNGLERMLIPKPEIYTYLSHTHKISQIHWIREPFTVPSLDLSNCVCLFCLFTFWIFGAQIGDDHVHAFSCGWLSPGTRLSLNWLQFCCVSVEEHVCISSRAFYVCPINSRLEVIHPSIWCTKLNITRRFNGFQWRWETKSFIPI